MTYFVYGLTLIVILLCISAPLGSVKQILLVVLALFFVWTSSAAYRVDKAKTMRNKLRPDSQEGPE